MIKYIIRRLLLLPVTLFGIVLITFCIVQMAPGDPASQKIQAATATLKGNETLRKEIIEQTRRIYGLDKPILFNSNPRTRSSHVKDTLNKVFNPTLEVRPAGYQQLLELGAVALPAFFERLSTAKPEDVSDDLLMLLPSVTFHELRYNQTVEKQKAISLWLEWWNQNKENYTATEAAGRTSAFLSNPADHNREALVQVGTYAVPFLIPRATKGNPEATSVLSTITRKPWEITRETPPEEIRNLKRKWREWWKENDSKFIEISSAKKFVRRFTDTRFGTWMGRVLVLDFGDSIKHNRPVSKLILERLPISLELQLISIFLTYLIAVPLGISMALKPNSFWDRFSSVVVFILYSLPSFFVANLLILFFTGGQHLHWFPNRGLHSPEFAGMTAEIAMQQDVFFAWLKDHIWHLVLPVVCFVYGSFAFTSKLMRGSLLDVIKADFIRTAHAKGLSNTWVIYKHALRNALIPLLTISAELLPALIGGSVIIEEIFTIDGMGRLMFEAIINRDYPIIMAGTFWSAILTLAGILLADLMYAVSDPRIKYS